MPTSKSLPITSSSISTGAATPPLDWSAARFSQLRQRFQNQLHLCRARAATRLLSTKHTFEYGSARVTIQTCGARIDVLQAVSLTIRPLWWHCSALTNDNPPSGTSRLLQVRTLQECKKRARQPCCCPALTLAMSTRLGQSTNLPSLANIANMNESQEPRSPVRLTARHQMADASKS